MFLGVFRCAKNFESCHIFCRQTGNERFKCNLCERFPSFKFAWYLWSHNTFVFQWNQLSVCYTIWKNTSIFTYFSLDVLVLNLVTLLLKSSKSRFDVGIQRAIFPIFPRFYNLILLSILSSIASRNFEELAAKVQR